jgi:hypothetical protein
VLETLLTQLETACRAVRTGRQHAAYPRARQRLLTLLAQTQALLEEQARLPVTMERDVAQMRACPPALLSAEAAARLARMEHVATVFHAQLTRARGRLAPLAATLGS